jgi:hypothetical protein
MTYDSGFFWHLFLASLATFIINLPFGYFRGGFRKLSFMWFLMIHLPVPLVVLIRRFNHLHLTWALAPFLVGSFFLGQFVGRKIYNLKPYKKDKGALK